MLSQGVAESRLAFSSMTFSQDIPALSVNVFQEIDRHTNQDNETLCSISKDSLSVVYNSKSLASFDCRRAASVQARSFNSNEMTATPEGYADPHFVLAGDSIEYRIRFQNTGSVVSEDIVITDLLDTSIFNLNSFQPLYASAPFAVALLDNGALEFTFNDIYLPDSASDVEGSQGFVVFCIELRSTLFPGTVIYNAADISFDQNPALTTNTVFHTIFDCDSFEAPSLVADLCENSMITIGQLQPYGETYSWSLDGLIISDTAVFELTAPQVGEHIIDWEVSNPLCGKSESFVLNVQPLPSLVLEPALGVCEGSDVVLNAISDGELIWEQDILNGTIMTIQSDAFFTAHATSVYGCVNEAQWEVNALPVPLAEIVVSDGTLSVQEGVSWQWYQDGQSLEGAIDAALDVTTDGNYSVVVTGENGCSTLSEEVQVTHVYEESSNGILICPHPITDAATLIMPPGAFDVRLLNALGQTVSEFGQQQNRMDIRSADLVEGIYFVQLTQADRVFFLRILVD
jgi:uncharacterized repeat protein (TIGR01451 family)